MGGAQQLLERALQEIGYMAQAIQSLHIKQVALEYILMHEQCAELREKIWPGMQAPTMEDFAKVVQDLVIPDMQTEAKRQANLIKEEEKSSIVIP